MVTEEYKNIEEGRAASANRKLRNELRTQIPDLKDMALTSLDDVGAMIDATDKIADHLADARVSMTDNTTALHRSLYEDSPRVLGTNTRLDYRRR